MSSSASIGRRSLFDPGAESRRSYPGEPNGVISGLWRRRPGELGTVVTQFAILGCGILSGIASGRLLGPCGRGELAAITLWPTLFVFLASVGVSQAIVFYTGRGRSPISEIWSAAIAIGLVQSLLVIAAGLVMLPILLGHYRANVQRLGFIFLICSPALGLSAFPVSLLQGMGDLRRFNLLRLMAPTCYALGLLALILLRYASLKAVVGTQVVGYVAAVVAGMGIVYRSEKLAFSWRAEVAEKLLSYGLKTHLANLASYLNQRVDQLILSLLIPAQELGLYAVAVTLAMSVSFFSVGAGLVTFSRGSRESDLEAKRTIGRSFRGSLVWLLLGCGALFFAAPFLITTLLGSEFVGSTVACRLLLPGVVALGLSQVLYNGANALGEPALPTYAEGAGLAATGIGLVVLVPRYGYVGAAIVSSVAYIVSLGVMLFIAAGRLRLGFRELLLPLQRRAVKQRRLVQA